MSDNLKKRLREDLEYWHTKGSPTTDDQFKVGVEESNFNVLDQEVVWDELHSSLMNVVSGLVKEYTHKFNGDKHAVIGAIVEILNKQFS